jgi:heme-degrading monooxygenase HmoA
VTLLEIDTVRMDMLAALKMYEDQVMPELKEQPGYRGALVLTTPEGKGVLVTFWETKENAEAGGDTGFYPATLERYMTLFRSPPGRERYEVAFAELPLATHT